MRLRNTNHRLPGGWRYQQFDQNGRLLHTFPASFDPWAMFLGRVLSFRKLNHLPGADPDTVEKDVTEFLAREFGGDPRYFTGTTAQKKTTSTPRSPSPSGLAKLAARSKALVGGATTVIDWLGDGLKPVAATLAQNRADACTGRLDGQPCPNNNNGWKPFESAASVIRAWASRKNEMNLSVLGEDKLHSCDVCLCSLPTKVWVPMKTILERTPNAMIEKFKAEAPEKCWMRKQT